jgi:hypothetical protein
MRLALSVGLGTVMVVSTLAAGADPVSALNPQPEPPSAQLGVLTAESAYGAPDLGSTMDVLAGVPAVELPPTSITPGYGVSTVPPTRGD